MIEIIQSNQLVNLILKILQDEHVCFMAKGHSQFCNLKTFLTQK